MWKRNKYEHRDVQHLCVRTFSHPRWRKLFGKQKTEVATPTQPGACCPVGDFGLLEQHPLSSCLEPCSLRMSEPRISNLLLPDSDRILHFAKGRQLDIYSICWWRVVWFESILLQHPLHEAITFAKAFQTLCGFTRRIITLQQSQNEQKSGIILGIVSAHRSM